MTWGEEEKGEPVKKTFAQTIFYSKIFFFSLKVEIEKDLKLKFVKYSVNTIFAQVVRIFLILVHFVSRFPQDNNFTFSNKYTYRCSSR